jgi:AbrB family looped-hinge helix DNA binding protein
MGISKVTRNFQVTLPHDIRELKHFKVGDKVIFVAREDRVEIVKIEKDAIKAAAGLWSEVNETGEHYQRRLRKEWSKRP